MSRFFQALERAEQERIFRKQHAKENQARVAEDVWRRRRHATASGEDPAAQVQPPRSTLALEPTPPTQDGIDPHLVSLIAHQTFAAEQYRVICHGIEQMHREAGFSVMAVSSPTAGDGKTTTAINLAGALAQTSKSSVLLVDLDLRHPSVGNLLSLTQARNEGVVGALLDATLSLDDIVQQRPPFNVAVLTAGSLSTSPHEILESPRLGMLLEEARQRYDYVVLDTPPLLPFLDNRFLEQWIDGFVVVVAAHRTPRKLIEETLTLIDPTKMAGLIFNNDDQLAFRYYSYYPYQSASKRRGRTWLGRIFNKE
jgi:capsular exopolysaccharide synthesis family protein